MIVSIKLPPLVLLRTSKTILYLPCCIMLWFEQDFKIRSTMTSSGLQNLLQPFKMKQVFRGCVMYVKLPDNSRLTTDVGCFSAFQSSASISARVPAETKDLQDNHQSQKSFFTWSVWNHPAECGDLGLKNWSLRKEKSSLTAWKKMTTLLSGVQRWTKRCELGCPRMFGSEWSPAPFQPKVPSVLRETRGHVSVASFNPDS